MYGLTIKYPNGLCNDMKEDHHNAGDRDNRTDDANIEIVESLQVYFFFSLEKQV